MRRGLSSDEISWLPAQYLLDLPIPPVKNKENARILSAIHIPTRVYQFHLVCVRPWLRLAVVDVCCDGGGDDRCCCVAVVAP